MCDRDAEKLGFILQIHENLLSGMQSLLKFSRIPTMTDLDAEAVEATKVVMEREAIETSKTPLTALELQHLSMLWSLPFLQKAFRHSNMQFADNLIYFYGRIDAVMSPEYMPTSADIVHIRSCTTNVVEHRFSMHGKELQIYDVGGQRNQQKKWIHMFDDVTAVIFVVSLNEFDEYLAEDLNMNAMKESLRVWKKVIHSPWFIDMPIILFLNKRVSSLPHPHPAS